jgi:hypothetical protein
MGAQMTRFLLPLALLAAALPPLAGRADADEVTLKCSFSLWGDRVAVGKGEWGGHYCPDKCKESAQSIEKHLARAPSQSFEITRVVDLADAGRHEPGEEHTITPGSIRILPVRKAMPLYPERGPTSGYFRIDAFEIARIDLSAKATFELFLGRAGGRARPPGEGPGFDFLGRPTKDNSGDEDNIVARVTVKGSCARVPKML